MAEAKDAKEPKDAKAAKEPKDAKDSKDGKDAKKPEGEAAAAPAKSKKKLMIIVGVAVLLLAGGGGAAYMLLGGKSKDAKEAAKDGKEVAEVKKDEHHKMPVFVDMDAFTVNLRDPEAERFMQVKIVFEVKDEHAADGVKAMTPAIRNEILLVLSGKEATEVVTREGKEKLAKELIEAASKPLEHTAAEGSILKVNFSHLIVQ